MPNEPPWHIETHAPDVAILIALPEEFQTLADDLRGEWSRKRNEKYAGNDYIFMGPNRYRCVVTIMGKMGSTQSDAFTQRLLEYEPAVIVNIGIAGGLKKGDSCIGDVLVPSEVAAYVDTGKVDVTGSERRGVNYHPSPDLVAEIEHLRYAYREAYQRWVDAGRDDLVQLLPEAKERRKTDALIKKNVLRCEPGLSTKHLASGNFVVASESFAEWIREANGDIHAVEMEAAGMMIALDCRLDPAHSLVIRGISDHVTVPKAQLDAIGRGALRGLAMRNAWRLLCTLMELGLLPRAKPKATAEQAKPSGGPRRDDIKTLVYALAGNKNSNCRDYQGLCDRIRDLANSSDFDGRVAIEALSNTDPFDYYNSRTLQRYVDLQKTGLFRRIEELDFAQQDNTKQWAQIMYGAMVACWTIREEEKSHEIRRRVLPVFRQPQNLDNSSMRTLLFETLTYSPSSEESRDDLSNELRDLALRDKGEVHGQDLLIRASMCSGCLFKRHKEHPKAFNSIEEARSQIEMLGDTAEPKTRFYVYLLEAILLSQDLISTNVFNSVLQQLEALRNQPELITKLNDPMAIAMSYYLRASSMFKRGDERWNEARWLVSNCCAPEIVGRHHSKSCRIPRSVALAFGRSRRLTPAT